MKLAELTETLYSLQVGVALQNTKFSQVSIWQHPFGELGGEERGQQRGKGGGRVMKYMPPTQHLPPSQSKGHALIQPAVVQNAVLLPS